jgi:hypothetical protein
MPEPMYQPIAENLQGDVSRCSPTMSAWSCSGSAESPSMRKAIGSGSQSAARNPSNPTT